MARKNKLSVDDLIVNLCYYFISGALILMQTLFYAARSVKLGGDDYTPEQKRALKEELDFTSKSIQALTNAQKAYKDCIRNLEIVARVYDLHLIQGSFDAGSANTNALLAHSLMYFHKADLDPEADDALQNYQLEYGETDEGVKKAYDALMKKCQTLGKNCK